jgi:hypothetical protein
MRQILLKSTFALALGVAPGLALAQTEMPKKNAPADQSEGRGGQHGGGAAQGEQGGRRLQENGGASGDGAPMQHGTRNMEQPRAPSGQGGGEQGNQQGERAQERGGRIQGQGDETGRPGTRSEQGGGEQGNQQGHRAQERGGGMQGGRHAMRPVGEEQRTELRRAFRENRTEASPNINFSVDVGARVPREVRLHRLPPRIVEIVPDYSGFEYFVLPDDRIAIVDPETLEVVAVIS